jgi:hypothetical protein
MSQGNSPSMTDDRFLSSVSRLKAGLTRFQPALLTPGSAVAVGQAVSACLSACERPSHNKCTVVAQALLPGTLAWHSCLPRRD